MSYRTKKLYHSFALTLILSSLYHVQRLLPRTHLPHPPMAASRPLLTSLRLATGSFLAFFFFSLIIFLLYFVHSSSVSKSSFIYIYVLHRTVIFLIPSRFLRIMIMLFHLLPPPNFSPCPLRWRTYRFFLKHLMVFPKEISFLFLQFCEVYFS